MTVLPDGAVRHRVVLTFDDGVSAKLVCPDAGCTPATVCASCGRSFDDPDSSPCYDCSQTSGDECWVKSWFDNLTVDELLRGEVTVWIDATYDGDHFAATIIGAA